MSDDDKTVKIVLQPGASAAVDGHTVEAADPATAAPDDEPAVKITLRTIYDEVKTTQMIVSPLPAKVDDHENRLRVVERFVERATARLEGSRVWTSSAVGLGGGVVGAVISYVLVHVR